MTRMGTGFCIAAVLGCATLRAQTQPPPTSSTTDQRTMTTDKARDINVTGCLAKSADGMYMLTNAKIEPSSASTAAGAATSTTGSTTATTGTTGATTTAGAASGMNAASSWALTGGSDLDKHVGHKIQVTGRSSDSSMDHGRMSMPPAAGTTAGTTGTTAGTTATTGGSASTTANQPKLEVQSVKMIAPSCP
jgi:hypothetical protein